MRFNSRELAALAQQDNHKFDKEGVLLIKEKQEGIFRKGEGKEPVHAMLNQPIFRKLKKFVSQNLLKLN